ncbi:MAG: hypothetical protein BGO42_07385 [Flavobacterium sp. 40-81]|nr:MAG: hypothetical protein ABS44_17000 [Chryseobacterium sp. SCN 40-13]OJV71235.1 MAG: hypothetical protein BGO42_07385 [Flavobacterium sp. 40-81]
MKNQPEWKTFILVFGTVCVYGYWPLKTKNGCLKSGTGNGCGFPHLLQPCFIRRMKYRVETL